MTASKKRLHFADTKTDTKRLKKDIIGLHSYRYAWAERAKTAGYPERYAQVNLGHNSKAMTRSYSRKAEVEMPSLSEYERQQRAIIGGHETKPVTQSVAA